MPDAAYQVNAADTGKLILIGVLAGNRVVSLPAPAAGLHYRFMATATLSHSATLTPNPAGNIVNGIFQVNNAGTTDTVAKTAAANAVMTATAVLGDYVDAYCDGTAWHVSGMTQVAAGLA